MTTAPNGALPALNVFADLRLVSGGHTATLVGEGRLLTFTAEAPQELLTGGPAVSRIAIGKMADLLGAAQLELRVVGPKGEIARLGSGVSSWWGRAVTGSALVQVGSLRAVALLAIPAARRLVYRLVRRDR